MIRPSTLVVYGPSGGRRRTWGGGGSLQVHVLRIDFLKDSNLALVAIREDAHLASHPVFLSPPPSLVGTFMFPTSFEIHDSLGNESHVALAQLRIRGGGHPF